MEETKIGVKETEDFLRAFNELGIFLIKRLRDGVQFDDFVALYDKLTKDDEFRSIMSNAFNDVSKIPEEVKDLDVEEMVKLISIQLTYAPKIIELIKKP
jgi:hypothetical protein